MNINEIRNGVAIMINGDPWVCIWFQHVKPGKGPAFVKSKFKNLKTGKVLDYTFRSSDILEEAPVSKTNAQYLYAQGDSVFLMDEKTFEQYEIDKSAVGEAINFLKEGTKVVVLKLDEVAFGIEVPKKVDLKVIESSPGDRGNTVTNATKIVKLETGAEISVPLFIKEGDIVRVNLETGQYSERVN